MHIFLLCHDPRSTVWLDITPSKPRRLLGSLKYPKTGGASDKWAKVRRWAAASLDQLPMWFELRGPETRSADVDLEENSSCLAPISQLINLQRIHWVCHRGWHIFSQLECNVMIFIRTRPHLLRFSLPASDIIVPDTELCLHMTQRKRAQFLFLVFLN